MRTNKKSQCKICNQHFPYDNFLQLHDSDDVMSKYQIATTFAL